jgi:hypothetical protein
MKKKKACLIILSVLLCIVVLLSVFFIFWQRQTQPFKHCDTVGWKVCTRLKSIQGRLENEEIKKIIFCYGNDEKKVDDWTIAFEVPQECLNETIALLDKAANQSKIIYSMNPWGHPALKIFKEGTICCGIPQIKIDIVTIPVITGKGFPEDGMKIITDKEKYLMPISWSSHTSIRGVDWASREIPKYLFECGWSYFDANHPLLKSESTPFIQTQPNFPQIRTLR